MAEHRPHPTDTTADITEADLLEQQTPLLTEHDPLEAAPPEVSPAALMVDEADYLEQTIPIADDYPYTSPTGDTDG